TNTVTVTGTNIAVSPLQATASITVNCPNLTLTKTADNSPVNLGDTIGFTITLANAGPGAATGVTAHDPLPAGAGANWSIDSQTTPLGTDCLISGAVGSQVVDCGPTGSETTSFTLASGASVTFHVTSGTSLAGACTTSTLTNTVTVTGTNIAVSPLQATASITVNCPNLTLTKTADNSPVNLGDTIGFTITLANAGPGAATGVTVHDPLPAGAGANWSIDSQTTPLGTDCLISGAVGSQVVDCGPTGSETTSFTLASGASVTFHVTSGTSLAGACTTSTLTNTVTVTGTNIAVSPLQATASTTVNCPNLTLT